MADISLNILLDFSAFGAEPYETIPTFPILKRIGTIGTFLIAGGFDWSG